ncbi:MAG: hypothetical protein IT385_09005 [Deltaproteobacteria bacterium]|nr:hypothetical protein [Deltaproteobacteria bacterium]
MDRPVPALPSSAWAILLSYVSLALTACPAEERAGAEDARDEADAPIDEGDVTRVDTSPHDTALPETAPAEVVDVATPEATDAAPETTGPAPGELGAACDEPEDCYSSYCLVGREASYCSRTCTSSCPNGWGCRQNVQVLPDVAFVCMPPWPTLCRPCRSNADCLAGYDVTPHACIPSGDDGAFCGSVCEADRDCPADAFCSQVEDIAGNTTRQCVPLSGACACSPSAIAERAATDCAVGNEAGRCPGVRACGADGLSACDAKTPEVDLCDGVDDNCDGRTDEAFIAAPCTRDNTFGSCPGVLRCDGPGGVVCEGRTPDAEACDSVDQDCDGQTDEADSRGCTTFHQDVDGDGFGVEASACLCRAAGTFSAAVAGDCDDGAKKVHPAGEEACNGVDDDCDGQTDEAGANGCIVFNRDLDDDGFGDPTEVACLCAAAAPFDTRDATDCDDELADVRPSALEACNGRDDDCDGQTDELGATGCALYFVDEDGDDFGLSSAFRCACAAGDVYTAALGGDCDDEDASAWPNAPELCGDGADDDCDGATDEPGAAGCEILFRDGDGDGFGLDADNQCLCAPTAPYLAIVAGDCADGEARAHPEGLEACDALDNDCDGQADEPGADGCEVFQQDRDRDGSGSASASACLCGAAFPFTAGTTDDCDDSNPFIGPTGTEICNGLDDDCDGDTDEGVTDQCSLFYRDTDQDGWGVEGESDCLCRPDLERGFTTNRIGDCDDARVEVYPLAEEVCNAADDDCDGSTDEAGSLGCVTYYKDGDGDGAGLAGDTRCLCAPTAPYTATTPNDCDDASAEVRPGGVEACNGQDDDCDALTDEGGAEGCAAWLRDNDGDGFGIAFDASCLCAPTGSYRAAVGGDCDDLAPAVNPDATEVCDGRDNDCNGVADDPGLPTCTLYYRDVDGDTYGVEAGSACLCAPVGTLTATRAGDCDDLLPSVRPSGVEACNSRDDDCDGGTDETGAAGCSSLLADHDGDGFGVVGDARCECRAGPVYRAVIGGDCDDDDASVSPGATEACNGKDDQCDGATDPDGASGCVVRHHDGDRDGFGASELERCLCTVEAPWDAAAGGDCDDTRAAVNPEAGEACNGLDDDCDGLQDEVGASGCATRYLDADGDKAGVAGVSLCLCSAQAAYSATVAGDCDDGDARRTPGKPELCNDVDDDCDLDVDEPGASGCATYYTDADRDTFGVDGSDVCLCGPELDVDAIRGGDCNDLNPAQTPAQIEVCDSVDNDCDGVVDEASCGLPTTGWPTFMGNTRRSGQLFTVDGPTASDTGLLWKKQLDASRAFDNTPIIDTAGKIVALLGDKVWRLEPSNGATLWTTTLPSVAYARASPTARVGDTYVVPHGNAVSLLGSDGRIIWTRDLGGGAGDLVVGAPLVDTAGRIFVVSNTHVHELGPDGAILWSTAITNTATHDSTPALGLDSRLYFATSDWVYSFSLAGTKNWEHCQRATPTSPCDATKKPGASVTVNEVGRLLVPMGDTLYQLQDTQTAATVNSSRVLTAGKTIFVTPAVYSDALDSSNPAEWPVGSPSGTDGLKLLNASLSIEATKTWSKRDGPSSTPIVDARGNIYLGSNAASGQKAVFSGRKNRRESTRGDAWWSYTVDGQHIDGAAALGNRQSGASTIRFVVFGDSTGTLYCVGK